MNVRGVHGEKNGSAKVTAQDVLKMRQSYVDGARRADLANTYGLSVSAVERILGGFTWASVTGGTNLLRQIHQEHTSTLRKLSWKQIQLLRKVAPYTVLTQRQWGVLLGVDQRTISNILSGVLYQQEDE